MTSISSMTIDDTSLYWEGWTLDLGLWTLDSELWTPDHGYTSCLTATPFTYSIHLGQSIPPQSHIDQLRPLLCRTSSSRMWTGLKILGHPSFIANPSQPTVGKTVQFTRDHETAPGAFLIKWWTNFLGSANHGYICIPKLALWAASNRLVSTPTLCLQSHSHW